MKKLLFILLLLGTRVYAQQNVELCPDEETGFFYNSTSSINGGTYVWTINGNVVSASQSVFIDWIAYPFGQYTLLLNYYDEDACPALPVTYNINVLECPDSELWAPNAFTPDGDEHNMVWKPIGYNVTDVHYQIFNRWGDMIFESYDIDVPWNGSYGGNGQYYVQDGVYVYKIYWKDVNGYPYQKYGHIVLIR